MTQEEIENTIETEAAQHAELNELQNNTSLMQFWLYVKKVFAFVAFTMYSNWEKFKAEINELIDSTEMGNTNWYVQQMYEFQYGHELIIENNRLVYAVTDLDAQIIKRVALKEKTDLTLLFKLAKENNSGILEPLSFQELNAASNYINKKKIAGTKIECVSLPGDLLDIEATVTLSPNVFNADGTSILTGVNEVETVIQSHLKSFNFGGIFYNSELIDKVMDVTGIIDFDLTKTKLNGSPFSGSIEVPSGWVVLGNNLIITYVLL